MEAGLIECESSESSAANCHKINWQRVSIYDDPLDIVRGARAAVKEANARAIRMQNQTTQQLVQRVKDLKYWSNEIDRFDLFYLEIYIYTTIR